MEQDEFEKSAIKDVLIISFVGLAIVLLLILLGIKILLGL